MTPPRLVPPPIHQTRPVRPDGGRTLLRVVAPCPRFCAAAGRVVGHHGRTRTGSYSRLESPDRPRPTRVRQWSFESFSPLTSLQAMWTLPIILHTHAGVKFHSTTPPRPVLWPGTGKRPAQCAGTPPRKRYSAGYSARPPRSWNLGGLMVCRSTERYGVTWIAAGADTPFTPGL